MGGFGATRVGGTCGGVGTIGDTGGGSAAAVIPKFGEVGVLGHESVTRPIGETGGGSATTVISEFGELGVLGQVSLTCPTEPTSLSKAAPAA